VPQRFRKRSRNVARKRLLAFATIVLLVALLFEIYQWIVPFRPANPLWQEVTVGQPVIDEWRYGGQDEQGYLRFYNQGQTVLLPPNAHTFDADGKFVVIEGFTPSSLTYAKPYEAIPLRWWLIGIGAMAVPILVLSIRARRRRKRMKLARRAWSLRAGERLAKLKWPQRRPLRAQRRSPRTRPAWSRRSWPIRKLFR
jgi:hypothetical protein